MNISSTFKNVQTTSANYCYSAVTIAENVQNIKTVQNSIGFNGIAVDQNGLVSIFTGSCTAYGSCFSLYMDREILM